MKNLMAVMIALFNLSSFAQEALEELKNSYVEISSDLTVPEFWERGGSGVSVTTHHTGFSEGKNQNDFHQRQMHYKSSPFCVLSWPAENRAFQPGANIKLEKGQLQINEVTIDPPEKFDPRYFDHYTSPRLRITFKDRPFCLICYGKRIDYEEVWGKKIRVRPDLAKREDSPTKLEELNRILSQEFQFKLKEQSSNDETSGVNKQ